eukprot:1140975-Pelagomonas_calceolata.AAC.3
MTQTGCFCLAGLNSAMAATGSAIELQSHKTGSLSHKLQQAVADLGRLRAMVYGEAPVGATGAAGSSVEGNNMVCAHDLGIGQCGVV